MPSANHGNEYPHIMAPTPAEEIDNLRTGHPANQPGSHVRWSLIAWLFVLSAVAFLDRVNISIAGGSLRKAYHISNVQLGWVFSSFLAGYSLFQTPGGRLADRLGPRLVLPAGVIWWGIFTP
jgi:MFS transporter, ACS family, glucarate transporter